MVSRDDSWPREFHCQPTPRRGADFVPLRGANPSGQDHPCRELRHSIGGQRVGSGRALCGPMPRKSGNAFAEASSSMSLIKPRWILGSQTSSLTGLASRVAVAATVDEDEGEEPSHAGAASSSGKGEGQPSATKGNAPGRGDCSYRAVVSETWRSSSSAAAANWSGAEWSRWSGTTATTEGWRSSRSAAAANLSGGSSSAAAADWSGALGAAAAVPTQKWWA
jgi:hypothetical protein